jgi:hypothetical protein
MRARDFRNQPGDFFSFPFFCFVSRNLQLFSQKSGFPPVIVAELPFAKPRADLQLTSPVVVALAAA